jgi:hypothetical protein
MGWGDLFLAAVLGATIAREHGPRALAVAVVFTFGSIYGLLLLGVDVIPATVPVAAALLVCEVAERVRRQDSVST